ncbi:MAG: YdcF family protein [Acidobacteriota bacterium]
MKFLSFAGRWLRRLTVALGTLFLIATVTPIVYWWATYLAGPWNDPRGDVLIVLTGSGMEDGEIGISSYWRAMYARRFYRAGEFSEILITGGGIEPIPIATTMRAFIVAQGVPESAVRVETASMNTRDSARNVAKLLSAEPDRYRNRKLVLMTSDYHMYRSHRMFEAAGVKVEPRPIPDIRKRYPAVLERWGLFLELTQESLKICYYWPRGWI